LNWFPDNTVLCNFASVSRMDLLHEFLGTHGRLAQSVEAEARASIAHWPLVEVVFRDGWFPPGVAAARSGEPERVETFRTVRMFGDPMKPLEHLGESETFVLIQGRDEYRGATFITDDHDAYRVVGRLGVNVKDTVDVLQHLVGWNSLTASEAYDLTLEMEFRGRELRRLPQSSREFEG
jgi:predicted nucleic acid-binding protein